MLRRKEKCVRNYWSLEKIFFNKVEVLYDLMRGFCNEEGRVELGMRYEVRL